MDNDVFVQVAQRVLFILAIVEDELEFGDNKWPACAFEVICDFLVLLLFTRVVFYNDWLLLLAHNMLLNACH